MTDPRLAEALGLVKAGDDQQDEQPEQAGDPRMREWQLRAAKLYGLPEALADRLEGGSSVEVQVDAMKLAKSLEPERPASVEALLLAKRQQKAIDATDRLINPRGASDPTPRGPDYPRPAPELIWQEADE